MCMQLATHPDHCPQIFNADLAADADLERTSFVVTCIWVHLNVVATVNAAYAPKLSIA